MSEREKALRNAGCEDVKSYMLVNNHGYTFNKGNNRYDLRHWLNCYGADVDYWSLDGRNIETKECVKLGKSTFDTIDQAIEFIKTL